MTLLKYNRVVISDVLALTAVCVQDGGVQTLETAIHTKQLETEGSYLMQSNSSFNLGKYPHFGFIKASGCGKINHMGNSQGTLSRRP